MLRVDFPTLQKITNDKQLNGQPALVSGECLYEFNACVSNCIGYCRDINVDELAMLTISTQSWINRRNDRTPRFPVNIGDVCFAELGNNYSPELAYSHPVLILEKIKGLYLVVPISTIPKYLSEAYHPIDNPDGKKFFRKVKTSDGFVCDCALILSNVRTISGGRLVKSISKLADTGESSLFYEVKMTVFQLLFPVQYKKFTTLIDKNRELQNEIDGLIKEKEQLENEIKRICMEMKSNNEQNNII